MNKYPVAFSKIMKRGIKFLNHMPHDGWTVAHLRAASHGCNSVRNTHPFVVGSWAVTHNGIWSEHEIARLAMSKWVKFLPGETDTIVAVHLINEIGPKKFALSVPSAGVYLALNNDGTLWVLHTSGQLNGKVLSNGTVLIASSMPDSIKNEFSFPEGWVHFERDGTYMAHKYTEHGVEDVWPPKEEVSYKSSFPSLSSTARSRGGNLMTGWYLGGMGVYHPE